MYGHPQSQLGTAGASMPRPLQDDPRQESEESRTANTFTSRFAPVGEEAKETNRLSRTSSVASLPESSANDSSVENLENQINALIKPLQDQITALTKQSSKLLEENLRFHKLLVDQGELIDRLTKNNEILELRLTEQQRSFDQKLSQERQAREATAKSIEDLQVKSLSRLEKHKEELHSELADQTTRVSNLNALLIETEQKHTQKNQEILSIFKGLEKFEISHFFKHIGYGEQTEAEQMLKSNPKLVLAYGDLTDCSKRTWKEITAFQYSLLVLDYHMWSMLLKYLPEKQARAQLEELTVNATLNENGWVIETTAAARWPNTGWNKLIEALKIHVDNYFRWGYRQSVDQWCKEVGLAQLVVPAHIINEYNHPDRHNGFLGCTWGDNEFVLPRTGVNDWYLSIKKIIGDRKDDMQGCVSTLVLGRDFAHYRGGHHQCEEYNGGNKWPESSVTNARDYNAMKALMTARVQQAQGLISKLINKNHNRPISTI